LKMALPNIFSPGNFCVLFFWGLMLFKLQFKPNLNSRLRSSTIWASAEQGKNVKNASRKAYGGHFRCFMVFAGIETLGKRN
jgi:hypothetical protein